MGKGGKAHEASAGTAVGWQLGAPPLRRRWRAAAGRHAFAKPCTLPVPAQPYLALCSRRVPRGAGGSACRWGSPKTRWRQLREGARRARLGKRRGHAARGCCPRVASGAQLGLLKARCNPPRGFSREANSLAARCGCGNAANQAWHSADPVLTRKGHQEGRGHQPAEGGRPHSLSAAQGGLEESKRRAIQKD